MLATGLMNDFAICILGTFSEAFKTCHHPIVPKVIQESLILILYHLHINSNSKHAFLLPRRRRCFGNNHVCQRNASYVRQAVMCRWSRLRRACLLHSILCEHAVRVYLRFKINSPFMPSDRKTISALMSDQ